MTVCIWLRSSVSEDAFFKVTAESEFVRDVKEREREREKKRKRKRKTERKKRCVRDGNARGCAQISPSEHVLGEAANRIGFIRATEEIALEHREIDTVVGFSVELERVVDGESSKRRDLELECENGGTRDRCEAVPREWKWISGGDSGTELDTVGEVQYECADRHQRTSALLGRTCVQDGQLGDLREGLEMSGTSVVELATTLPERSRESRWAGPHPKRIKFYR